VPFITPQDIPESDDCRSLSIPASSEWLALFGGALTEFLYSYNWEQTTGITVDETIAKMREIVNGFYDGCAPCTYEGGLRIIRIGIGGHLEELGDDGTWGEPSGDYVIPAPEAREGGTPTDQICLASKNAANVLKILYESWTESWASELTLDEAIVAAIGALVAIPAFFLFAPIAGAIALAIAGFLEIMFEAIEFLTADLWDEAFTNEIVCLFQSCATNTDGVVTFGWSCLNDAINARIDSFALTDEQLRLYGQIGYLMYFIGGTDGVNLAGSTTAITDDNCDFCNECSNCEIPTSEFWQQAGCVSDTTVGLAFDSEGMYSTFADYLGMGATTDLRDWVSAGASGWIVCFDMSETTDILDYQCAETVPLTMGSGTCYTGEQALTQTPNTPEFVPADKPFIYLAWYTLGGKITSFCVTPI